MPLGRRPPPWPPADPPGAAALTPRRALG